MSVAIACATGGFKGIFIQGVLATFEKSGFRADAYAAASSSVFPAASAAIGSASGMGPSLWQQGLSFYQRSGEGMSGMTLHWIHTYGPMLRDRLFNAGMPRFIISASAVVTEEAAEITQGDGARRKGRELLLNAGRGDRRWVDEHLQTHYFDTHSEAEYRLTPHNLYDVLYASTRVLHAWDIPAWVEDRPYIDSLYTCNIPVPLLVESGYEDIIAIANEPGPLYTDIFGDAEIPEQIDESRIHIIQPQSDPTRYGVDYTKAAALGLDAVYQAGQIEGRRFLEWWSHRGRD